jgi:murein DD-endopeptidase MepM/ murein hydrolase activator NlpD
MTLKEGTGIMRKISVCAILMAAILGCTDAMALNRQRIDVKDTSSVGKLPDTGMRVNTKGSLRDQQGKTADSSAGKNTGGPADVAGVGPEIIAPRVAKDLPDYGDYFLRPVIGGYISQGLHHNNAVDIAHTCGRRVMASAEGVVNTAWSDGWNGGYGKSVLVDHPNGTQTMYAHLSRVKVKAGDAVSRWTVIGKVGTTGQSTGCHLHFEVRGAKNPF